MAKFSSTNMKRERSYDSYEGVARLYLMVFMFFMTFTSDYGLVEGRVSSLMDNMKDKLAVKTIKAVDGDTIDCVDIFKQPALDHPLLYNHKIQMRPNSYPKGLETDMANVKEIHQPWHLNGRCPEGTVPLVRTQKSDQMRAVSPNNFNKKYPNEVFHPLAGDDQKNHEHATYFVNNTNSGGKAEINVWNPRVEPGDFSTSALSVTTREIQTYLSVGWMVNPSMYGDNLTRIFTYWTVDGSISTGCYNHQCSGFVQVNNVIALGGTASPISVYDGPQYQMSVSIFKDFKTGHWWLQMQGNALGYWPSSLVPRLANGAEVVQYGGEVFDSGGNGGGHTTTEMGSGHFGGEGERKASVFTHIQVVDPAKNAYVIPQQIFGFADRKSCYDLTAARVTQNWGLYFFYGGPGRNPNCP